MEKIHGVRKVLIQFKKSLFVLFNVSAQSVNYSLFFKNVEKHFCNMTSKKKLRQTHGKFTATFIGKTYRQ